MIYVLIAILLGACSRAPVNELDAMTKDVLNKKEGIDIQLRTLQEEKGVPIVEKKF